MPAIGISGRLRMHRLSVSEQYWGVPVLADCGCHSFAQSAGLHHSSVEDCFSQSELHAKSPQLTRMIFQRD